MKNQLVRLFIISIIFMFVFQLEARLFSYVYLFHEGLLLIQSMLIGGGFFLMMRHILPEQFRQTVESYTPLLILAAFFLQQVLFYRLNDFVVDFFALSILFGFIFLEIAQNIRLQSNHFYAVELIGSFIGVMLYAIGVLFFLEEYLLIITACTLLVYALAYTSARFLRTPTLVTLSVMVAIFAGMMWTNSIPVLMQCSVTGSSYGYKSACLDDISGLEPTVSFTHLKGRSDIYERLNTYDVEFLEVKNFGYRVSAANQEALRDEPWFELLEHRIPKLAYPRDARVMSVGAGAGSYIQALYDYIDTPDITAVEIDRTVEDIYESGLFDAYLPSLESYEIVYDEGRRYITFADEEYDVITIAIEGINSNFKKYVDERTGLLYTKEAFETYIDRLNPGGYLVLEQYYPRFEGGDEMATKFLGTLHAATGEDLDTFSKKLFLYSWSFHNNPIAQRYIAGVYKPDGFTDADIATIQDWINTFEETDLGTGANPHAITTLHSPEGFPNAVSFATFFDPDERERVAAVANTELTTDDKPFRHFVTAYPFPPFSYALFILLGGLFALIGGVLVRTRIVKNTKLILLSVLFGVLTFGLQYLLFYKTAAFLHFSLIFFAVFLLVPLFFGAIGGYFSTQLSMRANIISIGIFTVLAGLLMYLDIFTTPRTIIFSLIAGLFAISGFLFPRILALSNDEKERSVIYAVNVAAGGFAIAIMVTLHAKIGWNMSFAIVGGLMLASLIYLLRYVR